ncbi:aromatic compound catabolic protein [Couchioplanes caeruleus subsp. azureus]|nr:aromatic compound catabolic protein [Couchioplanes caeruleus subsp. azureus]
MVTVGDMTTTPTARTGEEFLRAIIAGEVPPPPITATLRFHLVEVGPGRAVFEGDAGEFVHNPMGTVHGGYLATLLDSALGSAVLSRLPAGRGYTTVQLNIHLVRGLTAGRLRAEAHAVHVGRTTATAEARLVGAADGKLYAHATTTCAILPA